MQIECEPRVGATYSIDDRGYLKAKNEHSEIVVIRLLPIDTTFVRPYDYRAFLSKPLIANNGSVGELSAGSLANGQPSLEDVWIRTIGDVSFETHVFIEHGVLVLESYVDNTKGGDLPRSFNVIQLPEQRLFENSSVFMTGDSMGDLRIRDADKVAEGEFSTGIYAVQMPTGAVLINSAIGSPYPLYMSKVDGIWQGIVNLPPSPVKSRFSIGRIEVRFGDCGQTLLENLASETSVRATQKPSPKCWNSWDFYHLSISEEKIARNVSAIKSDPFLRESIERIVVDMGWEVRFGEWEADPNFPHGMEAVARNIIGHGFRAGLWFAPVIIDPECNSLLDDYNSVGLNSYGFPDRTYECCGLFGYILDVTRPEGEEYLRNLFRRYREMGYTYFKLDFLRFLMYVDHFHDQTLTNTQVMQKALKIIREGAGEDAYILGCNLPFEVGPGYCDACRVSKDVAACWDAVKENAVSICSSYFWNGRWWTNDPDFLVVRGHETYSSTEKIMRTWFFARQDEFDKHEAVRRRFRHEHDIRNTLSLEEARTHASIELLNGGAFVLGDPISHLNEQGLNLHRKVLSAQTAPGRPVDLFACNGLSNIWVQRLSDRDRIGVFNWEDARATIDIDSEGIGIDMDDRVVFDFWTEELVTAKLDSVTLPPHHCRVFDIIEPPQSPLNEGMEVRISG